MNGRTHGETARDGNVQQAALHPGGKPQIPEGCGDEPVEACISAVEGWQQASGLPGEKM
jgi:hypothetical protein